MEPVIRALIQRLAGKGMALSHIANFIRDLANSLARNPVMTLQDLNAELKRLGWDDFELDVDTLELVLETFKLEEHAVRRSWRNSLAATQPLL